MKPSEEDLTAILDYIDGNLSPEQMVGFEIRLSKEPELAEECASFARMDDLQRAVAAVTERGRIHRLGPWGYLTAAAALVVAAGAAIEAWLSAPPRATLECQVVVLPCGVTLSDHNRILRLDPTFLPKGNDSLRSPGEERDWPSPRDYLEAVRAAEATRIEAGLSSQETTLQAGYYVLRFKTSVACSALVLSIDPDGVVRREFPTARQDAPPQHNRFQAGVTQVLPRENVVLTPELEASSRIDYEAGFLVPLGVGELRVLLALRADELEPDLYLELDTLLEKIPGTDLEPGTQGQASVARLRQWLDLNSFAVWEFGIREP